MRALLLLVLVVGCGDDSHASVDAAVDPHERIACTDQGGTCERACATAPTYEIVACTVRGDQHDPGLMTDRTFVFGGVRGTCVLAADLLTVFDECE